MQTYTVHIIHPTPAAEFDLHVVASSLPHARATAYRKINNRYGADTLYMVGDITINGRLI